MELIAEQTGRANRLEEENERLKKRIANREQHLAQMGELAKSILHSGTDETAESSRSTAVKASSDPQGGTGVLSDDDTDAY